MVLFNYLDKELNGMLGSPMVLFFILPLLAIEYLVTGFGDLMGINVDALSTWFEFIDVESLKSENIVQTVTPVLEFFFQMFN